MRDGVAERPEASRVVLAQEAPFRLGLVQVDPQLRQVTRGQQSAIIEPRVMQVLVVLGRGAGRVVSRDELVERCWDGRIVTDDAINRVLSRIRQLAAGIGAESFAVETIIRVGYRLTERVHALPDPPLPSIPELAQERRTSPVTRRQMLAAGGIAALVGAAAIGLRQFAAPSADPQAIQLVQRGDLLMREGLPGQIRQAGSYFQQATVIDPNYAEAWGKLALAYSHQMQGFDTEAAGSLPAMIRSAAARAQALEPGNADADMALIFTTPIYRRWADKERRLRDIIKRHPRHWLSHGRLGLVLQQVGRFEEALASNGRAVAIEPVLPISYALMIKALGALGRLQEADAMIARAQGQWPANPALFFTAYEHYLFSDRPQQAAALALDPSRQPKGPPPALFDSLRRLGEALAGTAPGPREAAAAELVAGPGNVPFTARALVLLGRGEGAEKMVRDYLLGPEADTSQRNTDMLFLRPLRQRQGAAAEDLLRRTGLTAYWAETRTRPDV